MIGGAFLLKYLATPPPSPIRFICWWRANGRADGTEAIIKYVKVDRNNICIQKIHVSFKTIWYFLQAFFWWSNKTHPGETSGRAGAEVQSLKYSFIIPTGSSEALWLIS